MWLATNDVYIGCWIGSVTIAKGTTINNLILYPPNKPNIPSNNMKWLTPKYEEGILCSPIIINKALICKRLTEVDTINSFISHLSTVGHPTCQMLKSILSNEAQGDPTEEPNNDYIPTTTVHTSILIEIELDKTLNINSSLKKL